MATATNIRSNRTRRSSAPEFKSKSEAMRAMFKEGKTITEVCKALGVGYAFAYGVAKRAGVNTTAANRRKARAVNVLDGVVEVKIVDTEGNFKGTVTVDLHTGQVKRTAPKATKTTK